MKTYNFTIEEPSDVISMIDGSTLTRAYVFKVNTLTDYVCEYFYDGLFINTITIPTHHRIYPLFRSKYIEVVREEKLKDLGL